MPSDIKRPDEAVAATPRPWRIEAVSDAVRIVVGEGRHKIILARLCPKQLSEQETAANAELIVASVNFYRDVDSLIETAIERCHSICDEHAEELIAMIGKDLGPDYGQKDRDERDKRVKDQACTARICARRIRQDVTPASIKESCRAVR